MNAFALWHSNLAALAAMVILLTLPGYLSLRALGINLKNLPWTYIVALSLAWMYIIALFLNALSLKFSSFSQGYVLLVVDLTCFALLGTCIYKKRPLYEFSLRKLIEALGYLPLVIIQLAVILLSCFGAWRLNNTGNSVLATAVYIIIGVLIIYLSLSKKMPQWQIKLWLITISLALVFSFSLRSNYLFGTDIHEEFAVFNEALKNLHWSGTGSASAYNTCLSITLLPLLIAKLFNVGGLFIYKCLLPALISLIPVAIFESSRNFLSKKLAVYSAILFLIFPTYNRILPMHLRTAVAIIFLAAFVLLLSDKKFIYKSSVHKALLLLFGAGLIVSHYSTAYLFMGILFMTKFIYSILNILSKKHTDLRRPVRLSYGLLTILFVFSFLWLAQVNPLNSNLSSSLRQGFKNIGSVFSQEHSSSQANIGDQFTQGAGVDSQAILNTYVQTAGGNDKNVLVAVPPPNIDTTRARWLGNLFSNAGQILNKLFKIVFVASPFLLFVVTRYFKKSSSKFWNEYIAFSLAAIAALIYVILFPYASIIYSIGRTYQMLLTIVAPVFIFITAVAFKRIKIPAQAIVAVLVTLFMYYSGLDVAIFGNGAMPSTLGNSGSAEYERYYRTDSDIYAVNWIIGQHPKNDVKTDGISQRMIEDIGSGTHIRATNIPLPISTKAKNYVFVGNTNKSGVGYSWLNGEPIRYIYPTSYLAESLDKIYTTNDADIYR